MRITRHLWFIYHLLTSEMRREMNSNGLPRLFCLCFNCSFADKVDSNGAAIHLAYALLHPIKNTPVTAILIITKVVSGKYPRATLLTSSPAGIPVTHAEAAVFNGARSADAPYPPRSVEEPVQPIIKGKAVPNESMTDRASPWLTRPIVAKIINAATSPPAKIAASFHRTPVSPLSTLATPAQASLSRRSTRSSFIPCTGKGGGLLILRACSDGTFSSDPSVDDAFCSSEADAVTL